ncbi:hypothetical protein scyTo_0003180, partial [Scyliorhinus torazame]|nr:hypothetical protein [Scyliorhinus torazame]
RFLEDHENLVETLSHWTRDSENTLLFVERKEKYAVFTNPQNFYIAKNKAEGKDMKEKNKGALLEECFCGTSVIVPELEGALCVKEDGKKSWKRRYFLLRASGIYYVPKGKTKTSRDLVCFIQFENVNIYYGMNYKAKYKAPTDHCFILKHPQIQKDSQYVKYLCCDDPWALQQWVTGIRIGKYNKTLYDNYKVALEQQLEEFNYEHTEARIQNEKLRRMNEDLQEQLDRTNKDLETTQFNLLVLQDEARNDHQQKAR